MHEEFKLLNYSAADINNDGRISHIELVGSPEFHLDDKFEGIGSIRLNEVVRPGRTLFVLPGMPARALPILQNAPLKWFAIPVLDFMDKKKIELARTHSDILFVRDPSLRDVADYETKHGRIWNRITDEQMLLTLKDIRQEDCDSIEASMLAYFSKKTNVTTKRPKVGNKIFSPDGIHPNDFGYDFWGTLCVATSIKCSF
jgi:hypothetical protein